MISRSRYLWGLVITTAAVMPACTTPPIDGFTSSGTSSGGNGGESSTSSSSGMGGAGGSAGAGQGGAGNGGNTGGSGGAGSGQGGSGNGGNTGGNGGGGGGPLGCADPTRVDLVLALDNSRSMADKQEILALAVPDLVQGLVNPPCIDPTGVQAPTQPANPTAACPMGLVRAFTPMTDIHFGVITSSIGGHGSDSCPNVDNGSSQCGANPNLTNNDKGRLLDRGDQCNATTVPTYANKKFLAWDPGQVLNPPGETQINDGMGGGLAPRLRDLVIGAGQIGCGYESQLESIYRFLVDPNPYETIMVQNNVAIPMGTDQVLLDQRKAFLRPDSLLTVVMLTDENDCSTKEYGQFYYVNQLRNGATSVRMPRPRAECATNPNDPCCKSCSQPLGSCTPDPTCIDPNTGGTAFLTSEEDNINLRCWDQKRRFGIDFLYPIDRYTKSFTQTMVTDRDGNVVPNPLFMDLDPTDNISKIRGPENVLVTGLVGVPWQDIARDKTNVSGGFKNAAELANLFVGTTYSTWDVIVGDPANYVAPLDPLMISTPQKRMGTNPITGDTLVDASNPGGNPINGHEWTITNDDLQYACIFPLLPGTARDCTNSMFPSCDCTVATSDNPLCAPDPANMNRPTLQVRAKSYPGTRPLQLFKSLGDQSIVGSICPAQVNAPLDSSFGYRPFVRSVTDWLTRRGCSM